jgi:hypothetical protein
MPESSRPFVWGNEEFRTVEEVERAIRAFLLDALGSGSTTDLTKVTRKSSFGTKEYELEAKIAVFVEAKR